MRPKLNVQSSYFDHPLWKVATDFPQEAAVSLLPELRVGSRAAREKLITGYIKLALVVSGQYVTLLKSRQLVDDIVGAALEGVVEGVDKLANPAYTGKDNPASYITESIHFAISEALDKHFRWDMEDNESVIQTALDPSTTTDAEEFEAFITNLAQNDLERAIIGGLKEGATEAQLADHLGLHINSVRVVRSALRERYELSITAGGKVCREK